MNPSWASSTDREPGKAALLINRGDVPIDVQLPRSIDRARQVVTLDCTPERRRISASDNPLQQQPYESQVITLPAFSIVAIIERPLRPSSAGLLSKRGPNLLMPLPHLTLWYPPYARQQPRFDSDGVYTVDLTEINSDQLAVIKLNLAGLPIDRKFPIVVRYEAAAIDGEGIGFVVKLPSSGPDETESGATRSKEFTSGETRNEFCLVAIGLSAVHTTNSSYHRTRADPTTTT